MGSHCVIQVDLDFTSIFLPQPPQCRLQERSTHRVWHVRRDNYHLHLKCLLLPVYTVKILPVLLKFKYMMHMYEKIMMRPSIMYN